MWERIRGSGGAAEILGIKPTTQEARMVKLGIKREKRNSSISSKPPENWRFRLQFFVAICMPPITQVAYGQWLKAFFDCRLFFWHTSCF